MWPPYISCLKVKETDCHNTLKPTLTPLFLTRESGKMPKVQAEGLHKASRP